MPNSLLPDRIISIIPTDGSAILFYSQVYDLLAGGITIIRVYPFALRVLQARSIRKTRAEDLHGRSDTR